MKYFQTNQKQSELEMQTQSIFVVVEKITKTFAFLIKAENQEQAKRIMVTSPEIDSSLFEIVEPTFLSELVHQELSLDADPWEKLEELGCTDAHHPSSY